MSNDARADDSPALNGNMMPTVPMSCDGFDTNADAMSPIVETTRPAICMILV